MRGVRPDEAAVDSLYKEFLPRQTQCLAEHSRLIAGIPDTAEALRSRGLRIGSTTGYTRPMLEYLLEQAREQGFVPDCAVVPGDVPGGGRPFPWMCYLNAIRLAVSPLWSMVKIGDTPSDVEEGLSAGMWTIGVTRTGNEVGLTYDEWEATGAAQKTELLAGAGKRLTAAGAHYVLESAVECLDVLSEIDDRIRAGERP
jgi:phosphonoacetaldehyde hydrolase